jgi:septation ring formation regulator
MKGKILIFVIITFVLVALILTISVVVFIRKKYKKNIENKINDLEIEKNKIISASLLTELNKAEGLINNENLKKKFNKWKSIFNEIKNNDYSSLDDEIIEISNLLSERKYGESFKKIADVELIIYYLKTKSYYLLEDIKSVTMSEERNRNAVTKLKIVYREVLNKYNLNKNDYKEISNAIELQFESIDKLFSTFEKVIDNHEYEELGKIVKALNDLINNMQIVVEESPSVIFMSKVLIPKKINDVISIYKKMSKDNYNLEFLNIGYNIEETNKKLSEILDRLKVLDLEDSIFELKTMLDYFENLFFDFEKEKSSKKAYEESIELIADKLSRLIRIVKNVYVEIDNLKDSYSLSENDISIIDSINKELFIIKDEFKLLSDRTQIKVTPYSNLSYDCELLSVRLFKAEDKLENTLRTLGSLKEDEVRAREQLIEIRGILKKAKYKIKEYKLPVIPKIYYIELNEAIEAIKEIVRELDKKPISIEVLNTRVDTARDLVLKVYSTANEMVKTAAMAEIAIVYGNRYRNDNKDIDNGLFKAEREFFKGSYKNSLEITLNILNVVEPGIHNKLLNAYKSN